MTLCNETLVAVGDLTDVGFLTRMNSHMRLQISVFSEVLEANFTLVWLIADMCPLMNFKPSLSLIFFSANFALKGFLSSVDHLVSFEMTFGYELFVAVFKCANIWSVTIVRPHVNL